MALKGISLSLGLQEPIVGGLDILLVIGDDLALAVKGEYGGLESLNLNFLVRHLHGEHMLSLLEHLLVVQACGLVSSDHHCVTSLFW